MRFRLRTLLIVLALAPPVLAMLVYLVVTVRYWNKYPSPVNGPPPPTFHRPSP